MKSALVLARRVAAAAGIAAIAVATAAAGNADAATTAPTTASASAVLVKTVTNAHGTLEVFKETATPDSSHGCAGSNPEVCLTVDGSGLHVNYMENSTRFAQPGGTDMQINGPGGIISDSGWFTENGGWYSLRWAPNAYIAGGYYCGTTYVGGGHEGACETVHN
jgi:hypothetical protein